ncbi:hypothetical protein Q9189_002057 [Teloschistes chrysophthalmus]
MDLYPHHEPTSSVNSAEPESQHGTPETKMTLLSPEEFRTDSNDTIQEDLRLNQPPAFLLGAVPVKTNSKGKASKHGPAYIQDPFVIHTSATPTIENAGLQKFSPAAPAFTPSGLASNPSDAVISHTLKVPAMLTPQRATNSPASPYSDPLLPGTSFVDLGFERVLSPGTSGTQPSRSSETSSSSIHSPGVARQSTKSGHFSSDGPVSRSVMISQIDRRIPASDLERLINPAKYRSLRHLVLESLSATGTVYASFTDVRDAIEVVSVLQELRSQWLAQYLPVPSYAIDTQHVRLSSISAPQFEGQLMVKAEFSGPAIYFNIGTVGRLILDLLNNYGNIMAYEAVHTMYPIVAYRAEFYETKDADHAMVHLNGFRIAACTMSVALYRGEGPLMIGGKESDLENSFHKMNLAGSTGTLSTPLQRSPLFSPYSIPSPNFTGTLTPNFSNPQQSPLLFGGTSPSYAMHGADVRSLVSLYPPASPAFGLRNAIWNGVDVTSHGHGAMIQRLHSPLHLPGTFRQNTRGAIKQGARNVQDYSGGHHNVVDVDRIRKGADVRTTIMLRNIPNKIDQTMLKEIVDDTSRGRYDFMYLRIDFANNCNVGYAFINFEDPYYIIEFVNARAGQRWYALAVEMPDSENEAEILLGIASIATKLPRYPTRVRVGFHFGGTRRLTFRSAIQGKDCLVQKFRNSSVMLEHPSFRPKVVSTSVSGCPHD